MKVIAFYLPQFHEIPENNRWWGDGFTEWTNVKKATPLFAGQYQPRVPLGNKYYNLLDKEVLSWQVDLAREYGVYGFCFYHYWFDGHLLLEKPVELFLASTDLDTHFCICWANENWTNAWAGKSEKILISQTYGDQNEWRHHMDYLLPFFNDSRYIKVDGKPLFVLYRPEIIPCLNEMLDFMNDYAIEKGLLGLTFAFQHVHYDLLENADKSRFQANIEYQPSYALAEMNAHSAQVSLKPFAFFPNVLKRSPWIYEILLSFRNKLRKVKVYNYDDVWEKVLGRLPADDTSYPGAFVDWDNTPRKGNLGFLFSGATPHKFKHYMKRQIVRTRELYSKDMLFIFAWNEWAEGGYLEPDERYGYGYLTALWEALNETDELESL